MIQITTFIEDIRRRGTALSTLQAILFPAVIQWNTELSASPWFTDEEISWREEEGGVSGLPLTLLLSGRARM